MNELNIKEREELIKFLKKGNDLGFDFIFFAFFLPILYCFFKFIYNIFIYRSNLNMFMVFVFAVIFLIIFILFMPSIRNNLKFYKTIKKVENDKYISKNVLIKDIKLDITYRKMNGVAGQIKFVQLIVFIENIDDGYNPFPDNIYDLKYRIKSFYNDEVLYQNIIDGKYSKECKLIYVDGFDGPDVFYFTQNN